MDSLFSNGEISQISNTLPNICNAKNELNNNEENRKASVKKSLELETENTFLLETMESLRKDIEDLQQKNGSLQPRQQHI